MSKLFFKCPNCGKAREVIRSNIYCTLKCVCNEGEISHNSKMFFMTNYTKEDILRFFDKNNIQWGFDEFFLVADSYGLKSKVFVNNKFVFYKVLIRGNGLCDVSVNGNFEFLKLDYETAKKACEEDFQLRRTMYDTGKSLQVLEKKFKEVGGLSRKVGEMLKDVLKNRGALKDED